MKKPPLEDVRIKDELAAFRSREAVTLARHKKRGFKSEEDWIAAQIKDHVDFLKSAYTKTKDKSFARERSEILAARLGREWGEIRDKLYAGTISVEQYISEAVESGIRGLTLPLMNEGYIADVHRDWLLNRMYIMVEDQRNFLPFPYELNDSIKNDLCKSARLSDMLNDLVEELCI